MARAGWRHACDEPGVGAARHVRSSELAANLRASTTEREIGKERSEARCAGFNRLRLFMVPPSLEDRLLPSLCQVCSQADRSTISTFAPISGSCLRGGTWLRGPKCLFVRSLAWSAAMPTRARTQRAIAHREGDKYTLRSHRGGARSGPSRAVGTPASRTTGDRAQPARSLLTLSINRSMANGLRM
jgi:hypothetical protein